MSFDNVPQDVMLSILSRLPSKTLMILRCVSKSWYSFITNPTFINYHLSNSLSNKDHEHLLFLRKGRYCRDRFPYTLIRENSAQERVELVMDLSAKHRNMDYELYLVVGSVRGLVCTKIGSAAYLLNPCIRTFKKLSPPRLTSVTCIDHCIFGFGFDPVANDYKVIVIEDAFDMYNEVDMYSLSTDSWKKIGVAEGLDGFKWSSSISLNGIIYWIVTPIPSSGIEVADRKKKMISFDIGQEQFQEIMLPNSQYPNCTNSDDISIHVVNKSVSLLVMPPGQSKHCYTWLMKKEHGGGDVGAEYSWTNKYRIVFPGGVDWWARGLTSSGEVLVVDDKQLLSVYDPKNNIYKETGRRLEWLFDCYTVTDSLLLA